MTHPVRIGPSPAPLTSWSAVASATAVSVVVMLPLLLVGALSPLIRADLGLDVAAMGLQISAYFLGVAATGVALGSVAERFGPRTSVRLALLGTAVASLAVGGFARNAWVLGAALLLAGISSALAQPAMAALLFVATRPEDQGFVFGIKQAAGPASSLLAGLSLSLLAVPFGWRSTFFMLCGLALMLVPALDRHHGWPRMERTSDRRSLRRPWVIVLGIAFGLGVASTAPLTTFLVESLVDKGISESLAGSVLAAGSAVAIFMRLVYGRLADRRRGWLMLRAAGLMFGGSLGYAGLAHPSVAVALVGVVTGFGVGWGWPGLLQLATVRLHPAEPARVTGVTNSSAATGAVIGPVLFTSVVGRAGFGAAWLTTAALSAGAGALVLAARSLARQERSDN